MSQSRHSGTPWKRIDDIDALRAFTLFGILMAHSLGFYGFNAQFDFSGSGLYNVLLSIFSGHFFPIFTLLFGCSFFLIMNGKSYSPVKFAIRCLVLFLIGCVTAYIYSYDVLTRYAVSGLMLIPFRRLSDRALLISGTCLLILSISIAPYLSILQFGPTDSWILNARYSAHPTLTEYFGCSLLETTRHSWSLLLDHGIFYFLSLMIFGYYIARKGVLSQLGKYVNVKTLAVFIAIALLSWALLSALPESQAVVPGILRALTDNILEISVALSFASAFLIVYRCRPRLRLFSWMCSYGRLGLTNYVGTDVSGVFVFVLVMVPCQCDITVILAYTLLVYVLQLAFSVYWTRGHRYGPLEWLWRKATDIGYRMLVKSKT